MGQGCPFCNSLNATASNNKIRDTCTNEVPLSFSKTNLSHDPMISASGRDHARSLRGMAGLAKSPGQGVLFLAVTSCAVASGKSLPVLHFPCQCKDGPESKGFTSGEESQPVE